MLSTTELFKNIDVETKRLLINDHKEELSLLICSNKIDYNAFKGFINSPITSPVILIDCVVFSGGDYTHIKTKGTSEWKSYITKIINKLINLYPNKLFVSINEYENCNFIKINDIASEIPKWEELINKWLLENNTTYLFTDGGCTGNGRINAKAAYAYAIYKYNKLLDEHSDLVKKIEIKGKKYTCSNQRAELTAILEVLKRAHETSDPNVLVIVTDSKYSINCIENWYVNWLSDPKKMADKLNVDLIDEIYNLLKLMRKTNKISFIHINSHLDPPPDPFDKFLWEGNNKVDKLCSDKLKC